jgi:histidinol-phosphatase (PHP family)
MLPADRWSGPARGRWRWACQRSRSPSTWTSRAGSFADELDDDHQFLGAYVGSNGTLTPPQIDLDGYLECVHRCRDLFPKLRIITGLELGEPHWHRDQVARLIGSRQFDRVLGSLHCLPLGERFSEPPNLFRQRQAADVMRDYLAEIPRLVESDMFSVLAHVDYPIRYWPARAEPFDPYAFQDEFRHALRALAERGRALEVNTRVPLAPAIVRW